jgi:hypothetical protein
MLSLNHRRRTLLRGVVAAGCVLSVPMVSGCKAKESPPKPAENSPAAGDMPGSQVSPSAVTKVSQAQAKYQAQPKGDQMCGTCANFIAPDSCKLVEGKVSANGWCTLWARKQA